MSCSGSNTAATVDFVLNAGATIDLATASDSYLTTLDFTPGTGDTSLQGETNLVGNSTAGVVVSTDTKFAINGGTLNALGSIQTLVGDVAVFGGGEIYVGDPMISALLDISTGSLTIGAPDPTSASTGGVVNLDLTSTLFLSATSTSTFVLKSDSELVLENGATIWMDTGFAALEIPEAETGLTAGKLRSLNTDNFIFGNLINHGIIEFGGTYLHNLQIGGDYIQGEEGVLAMRLKNITGLDQANDQLQVIGDAELDGGLLLTGLESLDSNQTWILIWTGNGISGNFADIEWPDENPDWESELVNFGLDFQISNPS